MTVRRLLFLCVLTHLVAWYGCGGGGGGGGTTPPPPGPTLASIIVTSPDSTIAKGTSTPFTATALYSNSTSSDVTFAALWASSHTAVSTVTVTGLALSVGQGTTTISAVYSGKTATAPLTVTDAVLVSLYLTPPAPSIPNGLTQQFIALGRYSDNNEQNVTPAWTSLNPSAATINASGLASSVAPGTATITAVYSGRTATVSLTVTDAVLASLELAPSNASVPNGWPQSFTATGTFTDSTTQDLTASAAWGSMNAAVASISGGVASSLSVGETTISAIHSGKTATALLTVRAAEPASLSLWPPSAEIANGKTQSFTATATLTDSTPLDVTNSAVWGSLNNLVSTISTTGLASSVAPGTTTISATYSGLTATAPLTITTASLVSLSISPSSSSLAKGLSQQFTATGHYSDNSDQDVTQSAVWSSSVGTVSTITTTGLALSVDQGTTTISAVYSGQTMTALMTVTQAVPARIDVTPINPILRLNATQQFTASKVYTDSLSEDVTNQVAWASSDSGVAAITSAGLASPVSMGTATISAADSGSGLTGTTFVLVRAYVTLPDTGQTQSYTGTWGEDADYLINAPSYMANADGTVTDLHTELVWQQQDSGDTRITWDGAKAYCQNLNLPGTGWRLPTRRELTTILDLGASTPKISGAYFPGTKADFYWSSEGVGSSNVLAVDFTTGVLFSAWIGNPSYARCVRGTELISHNYGDNSDGTVVDLATGLMWQKCSAGQNALDCSGTAGTKTWETAITYCEGLSLGGHDDWRLPNAKELESLLYGNADPSIHGSFPFTVSNIYWTSTSSTTSGTVTASSPPLTCAASSDAYIVKFSDRTSLCNSKTTQNSYVRCVRGGY